MWRTCLFLFVTLCVLCHTEGSAFHAENLDVPKKFSSGNPLKNNHVEQCSVKTYCPEGHHCCTAATCCPENVECCGDGLYCCDTEEAPPLPSIKAMKTEE